LVSLDRGLLSHQPFNPGLLAGKPRRRSSFTRRVLPQAPLSSAWIERIKAGILVVSAVVGWRGLRHEAGQQRKIGNQAGRDDVA